MMMDDDGMGLGLNWLWHVQRINSVRHANRSLDSFLFLFIYFFPGRATDRGAKA